MKIEYLNFLLLSYDLVPYFNLLAWKHRRISMLILYDLHQDIFYSCSFLVIYIVRIVSNNFL